MNLWWIYIPLIVQQHLYSMVTVISFSKGYTVTLDNALVKRVFHSTVGFYSVVEPNPPVPLSVSLTIFISTTTGMAAFSIITWAMASPSSNMMCLIGVVSQQNSDVTPVIWIYHSSLDGESVLKC